MTNKNIPRDLPLVVIIGRTNVGKSTLFNRLTESRQALVADLAGTTRDANLGEVEWNHRRFRLVDTGGFLDTAFLANKKKSAASIDELVQKQVRGWLLAADVILMVVDNHDGLMADDRRLAAIIKRMLPDAKEKVLLVANKTDAPSQAAQAGVFYKLALGDPISVSAVTGSSTGDLLDAVTEKIVAPQDSTATATSAPIKICFIGKPNVGKSSLLNAILGYERVIVSPVAHTTREPQYTDLTYHERRLRLIDTAGITRHSQQAAQLIKAGVAKSLTALDQSDIGLLILDVSQALTKQEAKLVEAVVERRKSLIIMANKWDLVEQRDTAAHTQEIYRLLPFARFAPIIFLSALKRTKINHLLDLILNIADNRHLEISDKELTRFIKSCLAKHKPTKGKGAKLPRIFAFEQTGTNPPEFMARIGAKENLAESYLGFIVNQLRQKYDLTGTPVKIWIKK